jgi:hypothetical protein
MATTVVALAGIPPSLEALTGITPSLVSLPRCGAIEVFHSLLPIPFCPGENPIPLGMGGVYTYNMVIFL